MNVANTIELCRLKEMLLYQKEKVKKLIFKLRF